MSPIFTFIVITLFILAVFDIIVGVANDAVNFLNSAIGSRIAPLRVILTVAAVGILIGTLTSSGMMEVARSGVFHPQQFTFAEIMMLFLAMIVADILHSRRDRMCPAYHLGCRLCHISIATALQSKYTKNHYPYRYICIGTCLCRQRPSKLYRGNTSRV